MVEGIDDFLVVLELLDVTEVPSHKVQGLPLRNINFRKVISLLLVQDQQHELPSLSCFMHSDPLRELTS